MTLIKHACKFCGTAITLELDEAGIEMFTVDFWKSLAACNRCADFLEKRRTIYSEIRKTVHQWSLATKEEKKAVSKKHLESVLRKWLQTMNVFFQTAIAWDDEVIDQMLNSNASPTSILLACERMLRQQTPTAALRVGRAAFPMQ